MLNDESAIPVTVGVDTLNCEIVETATACEYAVIWLHGLGADGHDFVPIVPELDLEKSYGFRFVFPHAAIIPVTINGGMKMRAWYDIRGMSMSRDQDIEGIGMSASQVEALISAELSRGISPEKIFLAGFSQGGALALYVGLRYPQRLAGICVLSAYPLMADQLEAERSEANREIPIFMAHGSEDPVVPLVAGESSAAQLNALNYPVTWQTYNMQHSVCTEEIQAVSTWIGGIVKNG